MNLIFSTPIILILAFIGISASSNAKVYTATLQGEYDDKNVWVPSYPGNIIKETDTVIINNNLELKTDIVVKGHLLIKKDGSLMGNKNIVVLETGSFLNFGISIMGALSNKGMVYNRHILEVSDDFINSGDLYNQESMVVGHIVDNIGVITGNGGHLIANKKFVNSQTGEIIGNLDICSNNFMNVDGGYIDSTKLSFCGHRIFNSLYLTASVKKERIVLSLSNSQKKDYKKFHVERSIDGINFETIATIDQVNEVDGNARVQYVDQDAIRSNSIHYRMRVITQTDKEEIIPAVEVGNIYSRKLNSSTF